MNTIRILGMTIATAAALFTIGPMRLFAQEFGEAPAEPVAPASEESWYRSPAPRAEKQSLAREKAISRGSARMARLEAMRWYGFSNSRPTAATMPFTTSYGSSWQYPGGRPFAWYANSRPVVIYTR